MAKQTRSKVVKPKAALVLRVTGPGVRSGRIPVPELLVVCQNAQAAVDRQAEALEGSSQTLRRGPKLGKVRAECTLELVSLGKGSAVLSFEQAKDQPHFPAVVNLGKEAIAKVGETIRKMGRGDTEGIDVGVLDSLKNLGELFDNGVRTIDWIVPGGPHGGRSIKATFNAKVRRRVVERLTPPATKPISLDGVLEMADFKNADLKCRIHPALGAPINCAFPPELADDVYAVLRQAARVEGNATVNTQTGKTENIDIISITPLDPLTVNAGNFFRGWTFDQLVHLQAVDTLRDPKVLAGGWPDDEDVDEAMTDIYQHRD